MKQAVLSLAVMLALVFVSIGSGKNPSADIFTDTASVLEPDYDTIEAMVYAFAMVESRGNHKAYNEREDAVGLLQIRPVMLREANRIAGEEVYTLDDRWDAEVSADIFRTVMERHNPTLDIDRAIDIWNPRCPAAYRNAVKAGYQEAINNLKEP